MVNEYLFFFFSSRRRHTRYWRDWSSDVCSSDLKGILIRTRNDICNCICLTTASYAQECLASTFTHTFDKLLYCFGLVSAGRKGIFCQCKTGRIAKQSVSTPIFPNGLIWLIPHRLLIWQLYGNSL